jgi:tRNA(Ile)-lysidine synthase
MSDAAPALPIETIDVALGPLVTESGLLIAVSGGPDSIALLHMLVEWRKRANAAPRLYAATVDHGLREASKAEADFVAQLCRTLEVDHATLAWAGEKPNHGLQAAARAARYRLLADEARRLGCSALVTAHTRDDQAETVLMRLAHGSGIDGLAAMRAVTVWDGLNLHRPLIDFSKASLIRFLNDRGQDYIDDPSNRDVRFERVRWRNLQAILAAEGLDAARLSTLARRAGEASDALEESAAGFALNRTDDGIELKHPDWLKLPRALRQRVIARAIRQLEPEAEIRLERLEALEVALVDPETRPRTLAGLIFNVKGDRIRARREGPRRRGLPR